MSETEAADDGAEEEEEEYIVDFWVNAECDMRIEATSEEDAIEQAKEAIEKHMHYGTVSPDGNSAKNFQARTTSR